MDIKKFKYFFSYLIIIILALLQSINYHFFIIEHDFAPAGLNGIITMIQYKTGFSISYMSLIMNIPLCIIAYFFLEKRYAIHTLIFTIVNSFSYLYLQKNRAWKPKIRCYRTRYYFPCYNKRCFSGSNKRILF